MPTWRVVVSVVLPAGRSGVLTGVMLAVARAAGETAPLLFTALGSRLVNVGGFGQPMDALPLFIYSGARQPIAAPQRPGLGRRAPAAALRAGRQRRRPGSIVGPQGRMMEEKMALETRPVEGPPAGPLRPAIAPVAVRVQPAAPDPAPAARSTKIEVRDLNLYYGSFRAVRDVTLDIPANEITAIIGPSGCGKSTFLRSFNRMHELAHGARMEGSILLDGVDIYDRGVDAVDLRRLVGMVFQRPNPFPTMSIYENVAAGPPPRRGAETERTWTRSWRAA